MKKQISTALAAAALICISVSSILAQARSVKTIYVADPTTSSSTPQDQERNKRIADAAVVFAEVRLNSLKDLNVKRGNSPCGSDGVQAQAQALPPDTTAPDSYEVKIAIRTLGVSGLDPNEKELEFVLDFDLLKYVKCTKTTLVHRSGPISEKIAFDAFLQMGDVLEVKLRSELAPPKINVDVSDISVETDSLRVIKEDLTSRLFARLASESEFRVRDIRGAKPSEDADYVITGVLTKDRKGVRFTVRNVKDSSKTQSPFVSAPTDQKNAEALDVFYMKAAEAVINFIRVCPLKPLTDDEVGNTIQQATELLCQNKPVCEPKASEVVLLLTRLSCTGKQTAASLKLLGDAYVLTEDFLKAADTYHQSWNMLTADRQDEIVSIISLEGDAWYRAENYGNAAQSYELAIVKSPDLQPPREGIYLQRARSYRFAADRQRALAAALDGLTKYRTSDELAAELALVVKNIPEGQLRSSYDLLLKNNNLEAVIKVLPGVEEKLAGYLIEQVSFKIYEQKNFNEVDQLLKVVETFPLASFPPQLQDYYKLMRAVWQIEAKNDFATALGVVKSFSEQASGFGEYARFFLANTYYRRARQTNNKDDYEKAVKLFEQLIERDSDFYGDPIYLKLAIANHELGEDQDTRSFLEERVQKNKNLKAALALISVCVNYLKDLACADKNTQFDDDDFARDFNVSKLELHVLRSEYTEAEELLHSMGILSQRIIQNEVTHFYRVWTLYALQREKDVQVAFDRWQDRMESVRGSDKPTYWVFDAANRALDAETKLSAAQKDRLHGMISAMVDKSRPLPK
jgi:hypothetical protein